MSVHLKKCCLIKVFRIISRDVDTQYWATDVMDSETAAVEDDRHQVRCWRPSVGPGGWQHVRRPSAEELWIWSERSYKGRDMRIGSPL